MQYEGGKGQGIKKNDRKIRKNSDRMKVRLRNQKILYRSILHANVHTSNGT